MGGGSKESAMASETSTVASAERGSGMLLLVYPVVSASPSTPG